MGAWRLLRLEFTAMASPCELLLEGRDERLLRHAGQAAIDEVHRIEAKYSRYRAASVVSRINAAAGGEPVELDEESSQLLDFADSLWRLSEGGFDATSGVLRRAWDFKAGRRPQPGELEALLPLVGWRQVERQGRRIRLPLAGMELDFGGFGKEYAADRAAAVLQNAGVAHALVNLGGDVHVLGARGDGRPWEVAVQHPRDAQGTLAAIPVARGGLATSGDYERFFLHEGVRYCHVLDARTGWPVNAWQSVSVLAANASAAGALATLAMLRGEGAPAWLEGQGAAYLAVRADGTLLRRDVG